MPPTKKSPPWLPELLAELNARGSKSYKKEELLEVIKNVSQTRFQVGQATVLETLAKNGLRLMDLQPMKRSRKTQDSYKPVRRFIWGSPSAYSTALSMRERSYLSHGTAAEILGILDEDQDPIYVNKEQSAKPAPSGVLTQDAVDRAFMNEARTSNYMYSFLGKQIVLLNGKNTGNLGVITKKGSEGEQLTITRLERTLVDIVVRPQYAGGVARVLQAFRKAASTVSSKMLLEVLDGLDYRYPYHQSLGFYLSHSGFTESDAGELYSRGVGMDFYLTNKMVKPLYDKKWRVYYPRLLEL